MRIPVSLLDNGLVNIPIVARQRIVKSFPRKRIILLVFFYVVHVVSKESRQLVPQRTYVFLNLLLLTLSIIYV
jgi:hypothetical protein